ncbi:hypothetical protein [Methylobacterium brachiatum]|uniref:hypothetical protein n=1 Tax=Methylobacterium brachiatum TaxID=269660 RepID=UPI00244D5B6C|nr:hypothetical protein [Methylobacterium brachiatum]MDH2313338.1 hypothetical protein [Methylobacterium brachiatum]
METALLVDVAGQPFGIPSNPLAAATADGREAAIRAGRAFVFSTGLFQVAAGNYLNARVENLAGSGRRVVIYKRRFDNNVIGGSAPLSYGGISAPAPIVAPAITSSGSNLITSGSASSALVLTAAMGAARINNAAGNATPTAQGFLPTNGEPLKLVEWRILLPGQAFANYIGGAGGGLAAAATCGFTFYAWEEPLP